MKETTTRLVVTINQEWGSNYSAEFKVTEVLFSTYDRLIDADMFVQTIKDALKRSGGFKMLTIDVTQGESWGMGRKMIASYRFTTDYAGEVKVSMASEHTNWHFNEWHHAVVKDVQKYTRVCVDVANKVYIQSVREMQTQTA
jgi:hypothetical protein